MTTKRTNEQWLRDLRASGPAHAQALQDLHQILLKGLRRGILSRINTGVPEFEAQADDFAQEAVLRILDKLDTFAGRSHFTTWAHKVAVSITLTELRRKRWDDTSLEAMTEGKDGGVYTPSFMADPDPDPEEAAERADMLARVNRLIREELTDKQRQALTLRILQGMPTRQVAGEMDMKANAVYKLVHDARLRLKRRLADEGLSPADVIAAFE